jgi:hypothetical protein
VPSFIDFIRSHLDYAATFGYRRLPDGCQLYGHLPQVAPQAWLHIVFPPLPTDLFRQLERDIGRAIPPSYAAFLQEANGLSLFGRALSFFGRQGPLRREDPDWRAPFSLVTPNTLERPEGVSESAFHIGGYGKDGSGLWMNFEAPQVILCRRNSAEPIHTWASFGLLLTSECARLSTYYGPAGRLQLPGNPLWTTAPPPA